jgi:hypothetical protein
MLALLPERKLAGDEANHSPSSKAGIENVWDFNTVLCMACSGRYTAHHKLEQRKWAQDRLITRAELREHQITVTK